MIMKRLSLKLKVSAGMGFYLFFYTSFLKVYAFLIDEELRIHFFFWPRF